MRIIQTITPLAIGLAGISLATMPVQAAPQGETEYSIFYQRYEPTFYTGFAPRTQDPSRVHIRVGRGNQVRLTTVLSDEAIDAYARDLVVRYHTYKGMVDTGQLVLTQNEGFEAFAQTMSEHGIEKIAQGQGGLSAGERRAQNLALIRALNPGRVFDINIPLDNAIANWLDELNDADFKKPSTSRQLDILNAMLPTRLHLAELKPEISKDLKKLLKKISIAGTGGIPAQIFEARADYVMLLNKLTDNRYPLVDGAFTFTEFTAIYPIGSFNGYTKHKGRNIPLYPTPGRRALTTHQRTKTVDHIPDKVIYSYSPWIPYMHVGKKMHNSFHTLWWRMEANKAKFLPASMRTAPKPDRTGKKYKYMWLLSRGPMSHGCTHVNTGHIGELRHILPSDTKRLYEIDVFLNKSHQFDVFDIDGDMTPEVMGVKYFYAYQLKNKRPSNLRAPAERGAFYDWLYGGALTINADGEGVFKDVESGKFLKRKPVKGKKYKNLRLYEAEFAPQHLQFYKNKGIPFARELRKVSATYNAAF